MMEIMPPAMVAKIMSSASTSKSFCCELTRIFEGEGATGLAAAFFAALRRLTNCSMRSAGEISVSISRRAAWVALGSARFFEGFLTLWERVAFEGLFARVCERGG